jgi:hypothetical protein
MKKESLIALLIAICFTSILGILILQITNQPQALLINDARLMFSDSTKISQHFSPTFNQQFQNVYCKSTDCESMADTQICNLFKKTPPDLMAISIFKAIHATAYGWPKVEMLPNGSFQMEYTIQSKQNFTLLLLGHKNEEYLVFDSIGNACELINKKPKFSRILQNSQAK